MRIIKKERNYFYGSHKGATLEIERERNGRFYIRVLWKDGGAMYDGYAPESITRMRDAKKEAIRGACL